MPIQAKWTITCVIIVMALWLSTIGRTKFRWLVADENWRRGRLDPMRWFLFEKNGDLRHGGLFAFYSAMLAILWLV